MIFAEVLTFSPKSPAETEVLDKRERGTGKQGKGTGKLGERCWVARFGRPPLHLRANGRMSVSGRAYMCERTLDSELYSVSLTWLCHFFWTRMDFR